MVDVDKYWQAHRKLISEVIAKEGVKLFQGQVISEQTVSGKKKYTVQRAENTIPDPIPYTTIAPGYKPAINEWVWCLDIQNGAIILGRNANATDTDLKGVADGTGIQNNAVGDRALASSATNNAARAVGPDHLKDSAVTKRAIGTNAVGDTELASGTTNATRAVDTGHIKDGAVTGRTIGSGAVGSSELASGTGQQPAVGTTNIKEGAVTDGKLAGSYVKQGGVTLSGNYYCNKELSAETYAFKTPDGWRTIKRESATGGYLWA